MNSEFTKKVLIFAVCIIGLKVGEYSLQTFREREPVAKEHEVVAKLENFISQLQTDATQKNPDIPVSVALQQEAAEQATKKIVSETDDLKRAKSAAGMFWGFYFVNARELPEFCSEQGVDIQPFVKAFERGHINELAKARSIYARLSADENKVYALLKPKARKIIIQDMNDLAASDKISIKLECQHMAENADAFAKEMHLSKVQPTVFQALSSAK